MLELEEDTATMAVADVDAATEDAYWQDAYRREGYYSPQLDYEDYAPAFCVGYIGYAQYGGCFEDAEKSLCANWVRIKGDSCLSIEDAMQAVQAAWEHAALSERRIREEEEELVDAGYMPAHAGAANQPVYATA